MLAQRKVKIVATIGPASSSREGLEKAIFAGMNVARLNFSHGEHKDHLSVIKNLRELSKKWEAPVAILQDLQGPKIRIGKVENGKIFLEDGAKLTVTVGGDIGTPGHLFTDFEPLPKSVTAGSRILIDDGLIELKVLSVSKKNVECEVIYGGELKDRKGMNIPGGNLPVDPLTEKDMIDLQFGLANNVDYVALSFVRRGEDIKRLRELVSEKNPHTKIIAKIEMLEALDNLEEIIQLSDGVMVARGDLAVEVGQTQLPALQKRIIRLSNQFRKPVITATQMLDSMVSNPRPTRAEITDVANAILDGSDALMLSAESASGKHPFKAIRTMHDISVEVEKNAEIYYDLSLEEETMEVPQAIAASACLTAMKINAKCLVCLSTTGRTAQLASSFRPRTPIVALTNQVEPLNRLELNWGIQTFRIRNYKSAEEILLQVEDLLLKIGMVAPGDKIVMTLGIPVSQKSKTNSIRVYTVTGSPEKRADKDLPLRRRMTEPPIS
jgi:pyruvate kinase